MTAAKSPPHGPEALAAPAVASKKQGFFSRRKHTPEEEVRKAARRKPGRRKLQRKSLQEYLEKAGYGTDAQKLRKNLFRFTIILFLLVSVLVLAYAAGLGADWLRTLLFLLALWTAVFAGVLLLLMATVYFFLDYKIYRRTRELEEVLPDFLQLASSNIAAGMPIDRALWYSIRPNFGVLAKEMEQVAKATMAGDNLEKSLIAFTKKYESKTLQRSVSILIEGLHAGGEMADLLEKIALNIDELKIMKKEMAANVMTYAIFILFASIAVAPFLFALATQLLEIIVQITGSLDLSSSGSLFTISSADPAIVGNFKVFSILILVISSLFSSAIVSVIRRGNVMDGIKSMPLYAILAVMIYYISLGFLGGLFGSLL